MQERDSRPLVFQKETECYEEETTETSQAEQG